MQNSGRRFFQNFVVLGLFLSWGQLVLARQAPKPISQQDGALVYQTSENGDRIPDFSFCGYEASEKAIPSVPAKVVMSPREGDVTAQLQSAIDHVGTLAMDENGFRGAVLLEPGIYEIGGQLVFSKSGVVLRGSGQGKTTLLGTGKTRETLVRVLGQDDREYGDTLKITDAYVPVNARELTVASALSAGSQVMVVRPSTQAWIDELSMNEFGGETGWIGWKPGGHDQYWDRTISKTDEGKVAFDVPLTNAIDQKYGGGFLVSYEWPGRIQHVGIEHLSMQSTYDQSNPKDEDHRWSAVSMESVQDAWVRQVDFRHFAGSAVAVYKTGRRITVEDCRSLAPVSEVGGERRNTFFTEGQQTLFQRCYSEYGYHDFSTGLATAGPNAFVQCKAYLPHSFSGAQQGWASGVLFDMVRIDGHALVFANRMQEGRGAGWTAANSVFWQCDAAEIRNYSPPTAQNWAFGAWAQFEGNGQWIETNNHVKPRSLYYAQLEDRLGDLPFEPFLMPVGSEPSSSPTVEQATEMTVLAREPLLTMEKWIQQAAIRNPIDPAAGSAKSLEALGIEPKDQTSTAAPKVAVIKGKLTWDGQLLTGSTQTVQWWRGSLRPRDIGRSRPHVTRFVPGRYGTGYTDVIPEVVATMKAEGSVALDHNYGLWYERRRDDHERVRRLDPDVWPPFYEQPFARSGQGEAWDRLSKYDLTKYSHFYWSRLDQFADLAEQEGIILMHQNYFQHNILEAGAHWADSPWRSANNINDTGFPEPPPYAGDKRIFMDEYFYNVDHPQRRELHRKFIRQCLGNFADNSNVMQFTSAEYTGPLHFTEFWVDVIGEWEAETGHDALVALSATKDVQDAILADPVRKELVEVIDIRYWHPSESGDYAPQGGKHMAPRQHARKMKQGKETPAAIYEGIKRYRDQFPDKAVIYSTPAGSRMGWAVLFAGGSLPNLPAVDAPAWKESLATMHPMESQNGHWIMQNDQGELLVYIAEKEAMGSAGYHELAPKDGEAVFIHAGSGAIIKEVKTLSETTSGLDIGADAPLILWIRKK
ncbi:DUF6298 domain-containing protein [Echinicola vietnamensis]|uniref:DUF6298 domain-containing protein n=1 Tax=Echinicola vietnamensis (strain DSM 17526 / LMG 23754 / KMM 6221) TaxID=926556 RepID=L0FX27_ECHVK|nr:DUF6298 domain-containing protein [Echinicola vietnamensis]AGA77205.1 hypothetical protein Echvi_0932 [Echinicola vietnamensis DSM 17526]